MSDVVIDASAVLAAIRREPGGDRGAQAARGARISALNYCEIIGWLAERGATEQDAHTIVMVFGLRAEDFDRSRAMSAGRLAAKTRGRDMSLADRACLALASELGFPALTGDRAWRDPDIGVEVRLIR